MITYDFGPDESWRPWCQEEDGEPVLPSDEFFALAHRLGSSFLMSSAGDGAGTNDPRLLVEGVCHE